ncbi:SpdD protein [Streptomyces phyllanthi]|uniref:SpdD protein n=1 Tax=Streptomyces phyllanthi TaxID=1803180 RepID=A0A5N8W645_9ACTN|nr:SpdD protein [Streptomyces phyllanthi]MPY42376.1 SpdD protein [Streptomyces phyllanthi]
MFTPKYPPQDTAPVPTATAPTTGPVPAPVTSAPVSNRPTVQLTPGSTLALVACGGAVVLVVGAVLVSMLLAVAITATSVAVCAVTIRSILKSR